MKKLITLVLALVCVLGLVGCNQKAVSASEVYSFPEPTTMITVSFYSQGEETAFEIGSEEYDSNDLSTTPVINWFYDLKLTACDEPEAVEGSESYEFYVKGESAFTYGAMPGFAKLPQKKNAAILKKRLQRSLNLIQF